MDTNTLKYLISLQLVQGIGPVLAKNLIAYCGSPAAVFHEKKSHLIRIPGIGEKTANMVLAFRDFERAEMEMEFIEKHKIVPLSYLDENYPQRLRDVPVAPVLLYYKGNCIMNQPKVLAFVGTRNATEYGKRICREIICDLRQYNVLIVSGLAFGIDHCAHKAALECGLPTIGVLGHGLDIIYPEKHRSLAVKMVGNGGLLTEFASGTIPEKENFPARNRIVAGMVDGIVVVETASKGGALITAEIGYSYNREIFAVPGKAGDEMSSGCNHLIRMNKAYLTENANDIAYHLGWDIQKEPVKKIKINFDELSGLEKRIIELLKLEEKINIDKLLAVTRAELPELTATLLNLEFREYITTVPGNFYKLV